MMNDKIDMREAAIRSLLRGVERGLDVVALVSDSTTTSKIKPFAEKHPDRLVNVGIAEQDLVGMAAGMALGGCVAVTANAAPFLVGRANEQVKVDICYAKSNVKMLGINAGVAYGPLAATHHSIDDVSIMRGFGSVLIFAPSDGPETEAILDWALEYDGPVYIRVDSASIPSMHEGSAPFVPGSLDVLSQGKEIAVFSSGCVTAEAYAAVQALRAEGIDAALINCPSLRPFDADGAVAAVAAAGMKAVTVEEHSVHGGLGSLVAEALADRGVAASLVRLGIPEGSFSVAGPRSAIRAHYGIDSAGIAAAARKIIRGEPKGDRP
jgi:transketolase